MPAKNLQPSTIVVFFGDFLNSFKAFHCIQCHAGFEFGVVSSAFSFYIRVCMLWFIDRTHTPQS